MARRRSLSFLAYARRRWRLIGLTIVAVLGTLLVLVLTDEGHEPIWRAELGEMQTLAVSPDGNTAFAVTRTGNKVTGVSAFDVAEGDALWSKTVLLTEPALVAAGDGWFAIATPVPGAQVAAYAARNGTALLTDFLEAEPRAIAADGDRLVVALRGGLVHVYEELAPAGDLRAPAGVSAVDAQGGRIAVATSDGRLVVWEGEREALNATRPLQIQSVRLSGDGTRLFMGGRSRGDVLLGGVVEYFDLAQSTTGEPTWSAELASRVSFVDMDLAGAVVVAVEESAPRYAVRAWDTSAGPRASWAAEVDGAIARDDPGRVGGVALSTDGRFLAVAPDLGGALRVLDARSGEPLWEFEAEGAGAIAFPQRTGGNRFVAAARLIPGTGYDRLLGFDTEREPLSSDFLRFAPLLVALELAAGAAAVGIGYWWYRRS